MKPLFPRSLKIGVAAAGLIAGLTIAAISGPMPQPAPVAPAAASAEIIPISDNSTGRHMNGEYWRRHRDRGHGWRGGHQWRGDHWNRRHYRHRHWRDDSGVYLGLGGFGLAAPYYYDDYYYRPRYRVYRPHRVYRGTSAHVRWCYARYRSYRAYDNTYQPYNGPRRQCRSPY